MIKSFKKLIFLSVCTIFLIQNVFGHEGHSKKPKMPAIGVIQGSVTDSTSGAPIEYASISSFFSPRLLIIFPSGDSSYSF